MPNGVSKSVIFDKIDVKLMFSSESVPDFQNSCTSCFMFRAPVSKEKRFSL